MKREDAVIENSRLP